MISEGHSPERLTKMNSVIRRIDLTCKLCAPVVSGFIISFVSLKASALTMAVWNSISVWVEYWLFISVYNGIPALEESSRRRVSRLSSQSNAESRKSASPQQRKSSISHDQDNSEVILEESLITKTNKLVSRVPYLDAWRVYLQQDVLFPGLALALLFLTVLR